MLRRAALRHLAGGFAALLLAAAAPLAARAQAPAPTQAPSEIKIGHLHASSGAFAGISMPVYYGLKLWVDQTNADGGAFVKAFNKKIPLRLISYDDQSNPATAATLTNQLITQDQVDMLISDSGSVLTAVSVPLAKEHKMFLFNPTGTGAPFFVDNHWIALLADPASTVWPKYLPEFLKNEGVKAGLKRIAILYSTNDFTGTQANTVRSMLSEPGSPVEIVFDQGVPTNTSNYTVLINNLANAKPDAVVELGYIGNDVAFLRNLQDSGQQFKFVFAIYPGLETEGLVKNVGAQGLNNVFTYVTANNLKYKPDVGMNIDEYKAAWEKAYPGGGVEFGFNAVAGYTVGIILQETLRNLDALTQENLRKAVFSLSGKLRTLDGAFELDANGAQIGEVTPLGQMKAEGNHVKINTIWPPDVANAKPDLSGVP